MYPLIFYERITNCRLDRYCSSSSSSSRHLHCITTACRCTGRASTVASATFSFSLPLTQSWSARSLVWLVIKSFSCRLLEPRKCSSIPRCYVQSIFSIRYWVFTVALPWWWENFYSGLYNKLTLKFILCGYFILLKNHNSNDFMRVNYG